MGTTGGADPVRMGPTSAIRTSVLRSEGVVRVSCADGVAIPTSDSSSVGRKMGVDPSVGRKRDVEGDAERVWARGAGVSSLLSGTSRSRSSI
jgi:hypothetical protein